MKEKDLKFVSKYLQIKVDDGALSQTHANDIVDMCRINLAEGEDEKLVIERWELKNVLDTFLMLTNTFPKIVERKSCLDRRLMDSYNRLAEIYNGEERKDMHVNYFNNGQKPKIECYEEKKAE